MTGNVASNPGSLGAFPVYGLHLNSGTTSNAPAGTPDAYQVCLHAVGNTIAAAGANGGDGFFVRQRFATTVRLPGYAGPSHDGAAVAAFVSANNGGATGLVATSVAGGGFVNGPACPS